MAEKTKKMLNIIFILWAIIFLAWGTSPAQEEKNKGPLLKIDTPTFDMGEIEEGNPITHTYIVKNAGTEDLKIEKVHPT